MVLRDEGPLYNIGSGVYKRTQEERAASVPVSGPNPESGPVAKALYGHPVMKFLAVSAATMVGMGVAGKVIKRGGVKLGIKISESESRWAREFAIGFRKAQKVLDEMQGVARIYADPEDPTKLFVRDAQGKYVFGASSYRGDLSEVVNNFFIRGEEVKEARRLGRDAVPSEWTLKEEIQQRLVAQARRLPYELPAAYVAERAVADPLFGEGGVSSKRDIKWYNPADVISDFVTQSVKNLAFMLGPFEVGTGAAMQAQRRVFSYGSGTVALDATRINRAKLSVALQSSLEEIGHSVGEIVDKAIKISGQTAGAFSTGVSEASKNRIGLVQFMHKLRHGEYAAQFKQQQGTANKIKYAVDNSPGIMGGSVTGFRAGRQRFGEIGTKHEAFKKLIRLGRTRFGQIEDENITRMFGRLGEEGYTPITAAASDIVRLGSGSPMVEGSQRFKSAWRKSEFYNQRLQDEYNKRFKEKLLERLVNQGIDEGRAKKLVDDLSGRISIDPTTSGESPLSARLRIGGKLQIIDVDKDNFVSEFLSRVGRYSSEDITQIAGVFEDAVKETDTLFVPRFGQKINPFRKEIDSKIAKEWSKIFSKDIPDMTQHMFGTRKIDYASIGVESESDVEFLVKKAADTLGISGDEQTVKSTLSKLGLDPSSPERLKGYLVGKNVIGKPWERGGYNLFGFRELAVDEYVDLELHGTGDERVGRVIKHLSDYKADERTVRTIPGIYQSKSGSVINVNKIKRSGRRILDIAASEYKIPIININPLQLLGFGKFQELTERPVINYIPGTSRQPFVAGLEERPDFYLLARRKGTASKGEVRAFTGKKAISLGEFQPTSSRSMGLAGAHARYASGDAGIGAPKEPPKENVFTRFFLRNNAPYQQGSIHGLWRRFSQRKFDVNNPSVFSRLLLGEEVKAGKRTFKFDEKFNVVNDLGEIVHTKEDVASALDVFHKTLQKYVLPEGVATPRVGEEISRSARDKIDSILSYGFRHPKTGKIDEVVRLKDLRTVEDKVLFANRMVKEEESQIGALFSAGRRDEAARLSRALSTLVKAPLKESSGAGYWDKVVGSGSTIRRRIDDFYSDLQSYLFIRRGLTAPVASADASMSETFTGAMSEMSALLRNMQSRGIISGSEVAEATAAMLSAQLHFAKLATFDKSLPAILNSINAIGTVVESLSSPTADPLRSALASVAESRHLGGAGPMGAVSRFMSKHFGMAADEFSGLTYNPFGRTDTVLTPTLGQAVRQAGARRTFASAVGATTYRDPHAFNPIGNFTSHLFGRFNRYLEVFGAGLDPTKFAGPLDFVARGIFGQRVLPFYAVGTIALTADATLGGFVGERDFRGDRVYDPLLLGTIARPIVEAQALGYGITPGGLTYGEAREQLLRGEVPVRRNRFWPLGRTPFRGEGVEYYRPSWYRRLKGGVSYGESGWSNPVERLLFGYDFSPLRPLDPYRYEREHYYDRPYPVTGDYFSGPFGPVTDILNATVGKIIKPAARMHIAETDLALNLGYAPIGSAGAVSTIPYLAAGPGLGQDVVPMGQSRGRVIGGGIGSLVGTDSGAPSGTGEGPRLGSLFRSSSLVSDTVGALNSDVLRYIYNRSRSVYTGSELARQTLQTSNFMLVAAASGGRTIGTGENISNAYGPPDIPGVMTPSVIPNQEPILENSIRYHIGSAAYKTQEFAGIYGFGFGALREKFGLGGKDFSPSRPVLESATYASSSTRSFWSLNIGGIGDAPSETLDLNVSEVIRRFVPKRRSDVNYINPIPNTLGARHPWLPGGEYYIDFTRGDPYIKIPEGEIRLPGQVYERFNKLHPDQTGIYGLVDQFKILANVAPYSRQFKALDQLLAASNLPPDQQLIVDDARRKAKTIVRKHEFSEYEARYDPDASFTSKAIERVTHLDSILTRKLGRKSSALEDWERRNVYGPTFQQWEKPIQSFLQPLVYENTQRSIHHASIRTGLAFSFFGRTPASKAVASTIGSAVGISSAAYGRAYKTLTGERFIPYYRKQQAALEEYVDILSYIKAMHAKNLALQAGDKQAAAHYESQARRTMYGLDLENATIDEVLAAIPKRKREHFVNFLTAPEQERERILSTSPRLERRILEAAWGMRVEEKPDLVEYFSDKELPGPEWEGWHPNTNMDMVKIKIGQNMGLDMSQMGYYPQQVAQANLVNPSYPDFTNRDRRDPRLVLEQLLQDSGGIGEIIEFPNPFGSNTIDVTHIKSSLMGLVA